MSSLEEHFYALHQCEHYLQHNSCTHKKTEVQSSFSMHKMSSSNVNVTEKNFIMNSRNPHEYWTYIQLAPIKYNNIELLLHFLSNELYKFSTIYFTLIGKFTSFHNPKTFFCHLLPLMSHTLGTPLTTSLGAPNDFVMLQSINNLNLGHFKYLATHDPCYRISKARIIFFYIFCKYQSTSNMSTF